MRTIDADELITLFPLGEFIRTECVRAIIYNMPTIEPQRMSGKWIPQGWNDTYCKCSCCDAVYVTAEIPYNFCPNCGADMRETE